MKLFHNRRAVSLTSYSNVLEFVLHHPFHVRFYTHTKPVSSHDVIGYSNPHKRKIVQAAKLSVSYSEGALSK